MNGRNQPGQIGQRGRSCYSPADTRPDAAADRRSQIDLDAFAPTRSIPGAYEQESWRLAVSSGGIRERAALILARWRSRAFLSRRVSGRIKLRGDLRRVHVAPSFRCDGDLWLGVHSPEGSITIEDGVSASGPLVITAIRPIRIGRACLFGPNVLVTDHYHGTAHDGEHRALPPAQRPLVSPGPISIAERVQFGANVVVLAPATIGAGAIVAANAVVKGEVSPDTVYTGLAARSQPAQGRA